MISNILLSPAATEPVTLAELKAHARISSGSDDALLTGLIKAARMWCEGYTRLSFIAQTWALSLIGPPATRNFINLPRAPLLSITRAQIYSDQDEAQTWSAAAYYADTMARPGRLVLRNDANWPEYERCANGLIVEYVAGFGVDASAVPEEIKLAIKQLALHWYEHRGEAAVGESVTRVPMTIEQLLLSYRLAGLGGI